MTKLVILLLDSNPTKGFIHNLNIEQAETILGGAYTYGFRIMNTTDRTYINAVDSSVRFDGGGAGSVNYHDNNINTITSSRSIYNRFIY
ncbi:hypothetical protein H6G74_06040 [Nostoc spongiaeforme FACHB-130]|uniref:Uncharacterized protein n=1 Tax=Nostoc spongiaeforme FACHB-130 TaxID=1357510 RepID=A0ABR8FU96_9NOSO|nr:hypothetical protein [Nostoc spongiaeforme]MBD2593890.1 hypothetical protein [Nostoc spongiaeforme FACHB-130]